MTDEEAPVQPGTYNLAEMQIRFGKSRSWVLLRAREPGFPKPRRLGKCLAWLRAEVEQYLLDLPLAKSGGVDAVAKIERARAARECA